jgi:hypothetical protein
MSGWLWFLLAIVIAVALWLIYKLVERLLEWINA